MTKKERDRTPSFSPLAFKEKEEGKWKDDEKEKYYDNAKEKEEDKERKKRKTKRERNRKGRREKNKGGEWRGWEEKKREVETKIWCKTEGVTSRKK